MFIYPVLFTYDDVKSSFPNRKTYESFLARSLKGGRISQIRKGLYGLNDPSTGHVMASKFQIACRLSETSFLDYHLALEYYGLTVQSFVSEVGVASLSRFRDFTFNEVSFRCLPTTLDASIINRMEEAGIRIVTKERLLVDSADRLDLSGGIEEVINAVSLLEEIDTEAVLKVLHLYHKAVLFLKVGYLLEKYYGGTINQSFYDECLSYRKEKKYYFGNKTIKGVYINKWRLIVPYSREDALNNLF